MLLGLGLANARKRNSTFCKTHTTLYCTVTNFCFSKNPRQSQWQQWRQTCQAFCCKTRWACSKASPSRRAAASFCHNHFSSRLSSPLRLRLRRHRCCLQCAPLSQRASRSLASKRNVTFRPRFGTIASPQCQSWYCMGGTVTVNANAIHCVS